MNKADITDGLSMSEVQLLRVTRQLATHTEGILKGYVKFPKLAEKLDNIAEVLKGLSKVARIEAELNEPSL